MKSELPLKLYLAVSGVVFLLVGILHLIRLVVHLPIMVGGTPVPEFLSYAGFPVAAGYAVWAFWLFRRMSR